MLDSCTRSRGCLSVGHMGRGSAKKYALGAYVGSQSHFIVGHTGKGSAKRCSRGVLVKRIKHKSDFARSQGLWDQSLGRGPAFMRLRMQYMFYRCFICTKHTCATEDMHCLNTKRKAILNDPIIFYCLQKKHLFCNHTGRAMELARECLKIWGYDRVDELIWVKTNQLQRLIRTGRTGHWLNHSKEHCLIGVKGKPALNKCVLACKCNIRS